MKSLLVFSIILVLNLTQVEASEIIFKGRKLSLNCETLETQTADLALNYKNSEVPYTAKVYLVYGSANSVIPSRWLNNKSLEMKRVEPFVYNSQSSIVIQSPDSVFKVANINFIIKIVLDDGKTYFDKGSDSKLGFYQVALSNQKTCVSSDNEYPDFSNWNVNRIIKN